MEAHRLLIELTSERMLLAEHFYRTESATSTGGASSS